MSISPIYLEKRDPEKNAYRFYSLHVTPSLFGDWTLVREWGQIGSPGQVRIDWFDTLEAVEQALSEKREEKLRRGYIQRGTQAFR